MLDGTDLLARNKNGESALHVSSRRAKHDVILSLAQAKADVLALDKDGNSALDVANNSICRSLLKLIGSDQWSPIMLATEQGLERLRKYLKFRDAKRCVGNKTPFTQWVLQDFGKRIRTTYFHWAWGPCDESSISVVSNGLRAVKTSGSPDFSCALGTCVFQGGIQCWAISVGNVQSMWLGIARGVNLERGLQSSPELCECDYLLAFGSEGNDAVIITNGTKPSFDNYTNLRYSSGQMVEFELDMSVHTLQIKVDGMVKIFARDIDDYDVRPYICMGFEGESAALLFMSETVPADQSPFDHLSTNARDIALDNQVWTPDMDSTIGLYSGRNQAVHDFSEDELRDLDSYLEGKNFPKQNFTLEIIAGRWNVLRAIETLGIESTCVMINSAGIPMESRAERKELVLYCGCVSGQENIEEGSFMLGDLVDGLYRNGNWYPAKIASINPNGTYQLSWDDGDTQDRVKTSQQIRLRNARKPKENVVCSLEGRQCAFCKFAQKYPEKTLADSKNFEFYRKIWGLTVNSVESAIQTGIDINARNRLGRTALHFASENGDDESVLELLKAGADPNILDWEKLSILDVAANINTVGLLKMAGADGWTALMVASEQGKEKVDEYFNLRDVVLSIYKQIPFPGWFEEKYRRSLKSTYMNWYWGFADKRNLSIECNGLVVRRVGDTHEFSGAVGNCSFADGIHRWSMRVKNVNIMWVGISRGIEETAEGIESAPGDFGEYVLAFCSDGSDPIIRGEQPKFQRIARVSSDDSKSSSSHKSDSESKEDESVNEEMQEEEETDSPECAFEDVEDDGGNEEDSEVPAYGISFNSGQIVILELNLIEHTLKVWVNDRLRAMVREIKESDVRPYMCIGGADSVDLMELVDISPVHENSNQFSSEDFSHAFDNRMWSVSVDNGLKSFSNVLAGQTVSWDDDTLANLSRALFTLSSPELSRKSTGAVAIRLNILAVIQRMHSDLWSANTGIALMYPRAFENLAQLIVQGSDVLTTEIHGQAAIHKAAASCHEEVVTLLFKASADINALDKANRSPLDLAKGKKQKDFLKSLGADGWTPLMIAAVEGTNKVLEYLCYRESLLCTHGKIPFPSRFEDLLLFTREATWTWGQHEKSSMKLDESKTTITKRNSSPDYSCALGSEVLENGVHTWAILVQHVDSMWLGIAQGSEDDLDCLESQPDNYTAGALIAFHHSGGEPIVIGCSPEFLNPKAADHALEVGSELAHSEEDKENREESEGSDQEEEGEEDEEDEDDQSEECNVSFNSGQIVEFTLDTFRRSLTVTVDGTIVGMARNIEVMGFRPYVCMDYSETATLMRRSWRAVSDSEETISTEHRKLAMDNSLWAEEMDRILKQYAEG